LERYTLNQRGKQMCCTGYCKWEVNDYVNGGTRCRRPLREPCPMEIDEDEYILIKYEDVNYESRNGYYIA
jgi:heterodisulfide reductase subunit A-like polyferredoxin